MRTIAFAVFGAMMSFAEDGVPKEGPHTRWPAWYRRQRGLQVSGRRLSIQEQAACTLLAALAISSLRDVTIRY